MSAREPQPSPDGIAGVLLRYAAFASLWILLSDQVVQWLFGDAAHILLASTLKGILFVLVTALLLYALLRRHQRRQLALAARMEQSRAEQQHTLHLLAAIADSSDDAIFAKDLQGRFILFNRAAGRFVGKAPEDMLGRDEHAIFPPEQAEMLITAGYQAIAGNRMDTREEALDTPAGKRVFLTTKGPLRDADGEVIGLFGIARDISGRKQAELALRQACALNRRYLDTVQTLMVALDAEGRITMLNRKGCELLGYEEAELLGLNWFEHCLPQPEGMQSIHPVFRCVMAGDLESAEHFENPVLCRDGRRRLFSWHNAYMTDDAGKIIGTLSSGMDITERNQAEQALRRQAGELARRNDELQRFNRAMVGRELDMIELKRQVNELSRQLGREPPYPLAFLDDAPPQTRGDMQGDKNP